MRPGPRSGFGRDALVALFAAIFATFVGLASATRARAAAPAISAAVRPAEIRIGEAARLQVTISGVPSPPAPKLPPIEGIAVRGSGQQMSMSITGGAMTVDVTHTFILEPERAGEFTIPAITIDANGRTLATVPQRLRVLAPGAARGAAPGAAGGAPPGAAHGAAAAQPSTAGADDARERSHPAPGEGELAALEVDLPARDLFVGELVPATLRLLLREGFRVTDVSVPTISGTAFAVTRKNDREPEQSDLVIDGVRYRAVSFPVAISPVTPGNHPLEARADVQAIVPRSRRQGRGDPFDDPFLGGFPGMGGEPRKLAVGSRPRTVTVLPLPEAGRPADFSGGIGRFSLSADANPRHVAAGDPVAIRTIVQGSGNFDRLALPALDPGPGWRTYPQSSKLEPSSPLGTEGRKVFEQAVVPLDANPTPLPRVGFSYFDPEARRYTTLTADEIAIAVAPAAAIATTGRTAAASGPKGAAPGPSDAASGYELAPNQISMGRLDAGREPLATQPWFLAAQLAPIAALAAGLLWIRRREERERDPAWGRARAAEIAVRAQLDAAKRACARADAIAFFAAARRAVQERVAARDGAPAQALTLPEVEARLAGSGELLEEVRELMRAADAAAYAGGAAEPRALEDWQVRVESLLRRLETSA